MSYIKAVQTIADDQTEVASKLQTLIDDEGIDAGEVKSFNVEPFGANKFIILLLYAMLREVRRFTNKTGLTVTSFTRKLALKRTLSPLIGLKPSFSWAIRIADVFSTAFGVSLDAGFVYKIGTKLNTKFGLKILSLSYIFNKTPSIVNSMGLKLVWAASYNGVPIDL